MTTERIRKQTRHHAPHVRLSFRSAVCSCGAKKLLRLVSREWLKRHAKCGGKP